MATDSAPSRPVTDAPMPQDRPLPVTDFSGVSPKFTFAFEHTLLREKGTSDHPSDHGGLTNTYGITTELALRYGYASCLDVDRAGAERIAMLEFWQPLRLEELESKYLAAEIFDTAYNGGPYAGVSLMQRAVNLIRLQPLATPPKARQMKATASPLAVDGRQGPKTVAAVNELCRLGYEKHLYHAANGFQFVRFVELAERDPSQNFAIAGWMLRLAVFREMLP